jgi:hypothetical protein
MKHATPKLEALVNAVKLLRLSKQWDDLSEDEWENLHTFLQDYGKAGSSQHYVGLAIISIQKKLRPLRQAIAAEETGKRDELLAG